MMFSNIFLAKIILRVIFLNKRKLLFSKSKQVATFFYITITCVGAGKAMLERDWTAATYSLRGVLLQLSLSQTHTHNKRTHILVQLSETEYLGTVVYDENLFLCLANVAYNTFKNLLFLQRQSF